MTYELDLANPLDGYEEITRGLKVGDVVRCKVYGGYIVTRETTCYDCIMEMVVISSYIPETNIREYTCYISDDDASVIRHSSFILKPEYMKRNKIHGKYLGDYAVTIKQKNVNKIVRKADGMSCIKCDEFYQTAAPNTSSGDLICYTCRQNPYI